MTEPVRIDDDHPWEQWVEGTGWVPMFSTVDFAGQVAEHIHRTAMRSMDTIAFQWVKDYIPGPPVKRTRRQMLVLKWRNFKTDWGYRLHVAAEALRGDHYCGDY